MATPCSMPRWTHPPGERPSADSHPPASGCRRNASTPYASRMRPTTVRGQPRRACPRCSRTSLHCACTGRGSTPASPPDSPQCTCGCRVGGVGSNAHGITRRARWWWRGPGGPSPTRRASRSTSRTDGHYLWGRHPGHERVRSCPGSGGSGRLAGLAPGVQEVVVGSLIGPYDLVPLLAYPVLGLVSLVL